MTDIEKYGGDETLALIENLSSRIDALESALSEQGEGLSVRKLQGDIDELKTRIDSVENASSSEDDYATSVATNTPTAPNVYEADANYPFEIMYDAQAEGESQNRAWYIYLPDGCVKNANANVEFLENDVVKDRSSKIQEYAEIVNVPEVLYGHVKEYNGVYKYTIDGTDTLAGSVLDFKIAKMEMVESNANEVCIQYVRNVVVVGGGGGFVDNGCFRIDSIADGLLTLSNCYISIGGKMYDIGDENTHQLSVGIAANNLVAVVLSSVSQEPYAEISTYESRAAAIIASASTNKYVLPLYEFGENLSVACDFRNIPTAVMYEF